VGSRRLRRRHANTRARWASAAEARPRGVARRPVVPSHAPAPARQRAYRRRRGRPAASPPPQARSPAPPAAAALNSSESMPSAPTRLQSFAAKCAEARKDAQRREGIDLSRSSYQLCETLRHSFAPVVVPPSPHPRQRVGRVRDTPIGDQGSAGAWFGLEASGSRFQPVCSSTNSSQPRRR
jgi:hypothetical protein